MATTYIVLQEVKAVVGAFADREVTLLDILGTAEADTPREAVKVYSEPEGGDPVEGPFVAVPSRNWSEERAVVETRVRYESGGYSGQTTIEEALAEDAEELAAAIEGNGDDDPPPPSRGRAVRAVEDDGA